MVNQTGSRTVRLGVIGGGWASQFHMRACTDVGGIEVVAIADIAPEVARQTASTWGIPDVYSSDEELLKDDSIEAVIVCTPSGIHAEPTIAALNAGKHVLVEKPMDARLGSAIEMVRTAHDTGRILMTALKLRFSSEMIAAKRIVESGALGYIYYAEAVADRRRSTPRGSFIKKDLAGLGASADLGVYALDTALYLMGNPRPVSVCGITSNYISRNAGDVIGQRDDLPRGIEVEDFAAAWIRFENGARLVLKTSWCTNMDSLGGTYLLGETAGLRIGVQEVRGPQEGVCLYRDEFGAMTNVMVQTPAPVDNMELFRREDRAFTDAVRAGGPSPIDPDGVLLANVIIQGIVDSVDAGGREIEVSVPDLHGSGEHSRETGSPVASISVQGTA